MNNPLAPMPTAASLPALESAERHCARAITAHLAGGAEQLPRDITERLRFGRERALERARLARSAAAAQSLGVSSGGAGLLGRAPGWLFRVVSALPIVVLVCGLVAIEHRDRKIQIDVAAEVDAALLADDLPPSAYRDAGFVEFLKTPPRE